MLCVCKREKERWARLFPHMRAAGAQLIKDQALEMELEPAKNSSASFIFSKAPGHIGAVGGTRFEYAAIR